MKRITYNSPVILTFAILSLCVLILDSVTGGNTTGALFCVYRAPLTDPLTYFRFFGYVLGHADINHYMNNMLLLLVIGPPLEEKYGGKSLIMAMLMTAFIAGAVQFVFFPGSALLGASGIVFMMIVMSSLVNFRHGTIPLTLIIVIILYVGTEIVSGIIQQDNVSQLAHILGGICGAVIGIRLAGRKRR